MISRLTSIEETRVQLSESSDMSLLEASKSMVFVFLIIMGVSLLGTLTRPAPGCLATLWPSNAVLLGLFIRRPKFNKWFIWMTGYAAYIFIDLISGNPVFQTFAINGVNIIGIASGLIISQQYLRPNGGRIMDTPQSVLKYFVMIVAIAVITGTVGAVINPIVFKNLSMIDGFKAWFTGEFVNYLVILPVLLTFQPGSWQFRGNMFRRSSSGVEFVLKLLPVAALSLSLVMSYYLRGPGSIAFAVPALLWCAITYNIFTMAVLNSIFSSITLMAVNYLQHFENNINFGPGSNVVSMRIGVALITLAPILICSIMKSRSDLMKKLEHIASHDCLTKVLNRSGIDMQYHQYRFQNSGKLTGVLLIDLDFFKKINDTYGHEGGNLALKEFAKIIKSNMRDTDIFGRIGGEEFVVILPLSEEEELGRIADRFCEIISKSPFAISGTGTIIHITISIGGVIADEPYNELDLMLAEADKALYYVKNNGRNCKKIYSYMSQIGE